MSYGVNRWAAPSGSTARRAASAKPRAKGRAKPRSARPAPKRKSSSKAKSGKSRKLAAKKRPGKKPAARKPVSTKKYVAYDPLTGRKYMMLKSDERYAIWPHRKPSKKKIQAEKVSAVTGLSPTASAVITPAVAKAIGKGGTTAKRTVQKLLSQYVAPALATAGASAGIGVAGTAALAIAAGVAGYWFGSALVHQGATYDARLKSVSDAYRYARIDLASRLGRQPTADEIGPLTQKYREFIAIAKSGQSPSSYYRTTQ